jgi:hypothetical protein
VRFFHPILLWGLLAAAIPIIIHLINRRRHKTVRWAAMQFLLKAARESRGKKRIRHILILACRALGIAALAAAAARPVVSGLLGWGSGQIDVVVLILDRSASMEARPADGLAPRRQMILEKTRAAMKELPGARLVLIDSATGIPQDVPSPDVLPDLSATTPTDTAADIPALVSKAVEYLTETPSRAEIWIASDLQTSNWQPNSEQWAATRARLDSLPQKTALRILALNGPAAPNASLRLLGSRRSANDLILDLEILRSDESRTATNIPLTSNLNGTRTTENVTIAGQSLRFQKHVALPADATTSHGWVSIPADGNTSDNVAFFACGPARPAKSLVVAPPGETATYLTLAAAPPGFGNQSAERIDPAQAAFRLSAPDLATVLWAAPLPEATTADALTRFLSSGGQVVFFPPGLASTKPFLGVKWSAPADSPKGKFFILTDWNHEDGLLRDGIDGTPIPGERLKAIRRQAPEGEFTTLARWDDHTPFLARLAHDRGTAWFAASLPDYSWSNLGDADVLLPLAQRSVLAGAERYDSSYISSVGSEPSRPREGEIVTRLDDYGTSSRASSVFQAGVFRLGERLLALNRPAAEDLPDSLSRENLDTILQGTGYHLLEQSARTADDSLATEIWRAFLIAMLFFLIAEALLCLPPKPSGQTPVARSTTGHTRGPATTRNDPNASAGRS